MRQRIRDHIHVKGLILVFAFISLADITGQATGDLREDYLFGEYYLSMAEFDNAIPFLQACVAKDQENSRYNYLLGKCYANLLGQQEKALPYLEVAVKNIDDHYVEGKHTRAGAPPEAWLLLGEAYHRKNELTRASYAYHQYLSYIDAEDEESVAEIRSRLAGLGISYEFQRNESDVEIINLGPRINTRFSDYNPAVSGDLRTMVFTQYWESYDRIMYSASTNGEWSQAEDLNEQIGSDGGFFTSALSYQGDEMYLIRFWEQEFDIYVSIKKDGSWRSMKKIPGKVNSRYRETSVSVSADGQELYFSSDRRGGFGGFDLYVSQWTGKQWDDPVNLGPVINTPGNEEAPFINPGNNKLYFSSDGHETIGNMDIFVSIRGPEGNWNEPVNVGPPINTTDDDLSLIYFDESDFGFIVKDLPEGFGKNDIYRIENAVIARTGIDPMIELLAEFTPAQPAATVSREPTDIPDTGIDSMADQQTETPSQANSQSIAVGVSEVTALNDHSTLRTANEDLPEAVPQTGNLLEKDASSSVRQAKESKSDKVYVIQIVALRKNFDPGRVNLSPVTVSRGEDGFNRYTFGEFPTVEAAEAHLREIWEMGYTDAFIREIGGISNYE